MSRISLKALRTICGAFVLVSAMVFADEQNSAEAPAQQSDKIENHVQVGTRRMSHADHVAVQEKRAEEARKASVELGGESDSCEKCKKNKLVEAVMDSKEARMAMSSKGIKKHNAGLYVTTHQGAFHNPLSVSMLGDAITLEDGSVWAVSGDDSYKTLNWLTSDLLVITPNHSWFSIYDYVITNQNTGVCVKVNLILGPLVDAVYRHWIIAIDYLLDRVWLEDGSIWTMTDCTVMKQWQIGDSVIIGINDGWFTSSYPNILINVNMLNYGRGICTY